jgi:hypothetical protein
MPLLSTMEMWLVEGSSGVASRPWPAPVAVAGLGDAHGAVADKVPPLRQIALVQQACHRHVDDVAVGHVLVAIGEGEACRLAVEVNGLAGGGQLTLLPLYRFEGGHVPALQHAENLAKGDGAGGGVGKPQISLWR